ncbi:MAG: hemolysin family protein [Paludibacteraceae bacterium]|nr:hemolysin family protein [Paludibacteraceae bacterium]
MALLLVFLLTAMAVSFLCSTLEASLMSTTISYIHTMEKEGIKSAKLMLKYKTATERPLAAILSLNTIANTVGAAGVGQQATIVFGSEWFGLVSAIVTLLILVFSEIIPKTIGTNYWKSLMGFTAYTIRVLIIILYPFVKLIEWLSKIFPDSDATSVSREEVIAIANVGEAEGVIEQDENTIIRNVMHLNEIKASDVMTPRVVSAVAAESMSIQDYYDSDEYDHFSRIPVYADSPEYITGYVLRDEALEELAEDQFSKKLGDIKRKIPYFNEDKPIGDIFDSMLKQKSQIALIIDEYGCFQGILTMEDIIETIFGLEITDESDVITDMRQYARERWQQRLKRKEQIKIKKRTANNK